MKPIILSPKTTTGAENNNKVDQLKKLELLVLTQNQDQQKLDTAKFVEDGPSQICKTDLDGSSNHQAQVDRAEIEQAQVEKAQAF